MKKLIFSLSFLALTGVAYAQNSAIYKVNALLEKNDLQGAVKELDAALANPKTTKFQEFYNKAGEVQVRLFTPELMKAAQSMPFDTLAFVDAVDKAITFYSKSHEAGLQPDAKGKVKSDAKIDADNKFRLKSCLDYYNYAAMFLYQNKDVQGAIKYFQKYVDLPKNPIFTQADRDSIYAEKKGAYQQALFNLTYMNYMNKNWDAVISNATEALQDTLGVNDLYLMKSQAYLEKKDTVQWVKTLKEAVDRTDNANFAQNLLYYYVQKGDVAEATAAADEMVAARPNSKMAWYLKGCVDLNMKKDYAGARGSFEKALALDPAFVDANKNMGITYINEVIERRDKGEYKLDRKDVKRFNEEYAKIKKFYEGARPYFEKVKELVPNDPKQWVYYLSNVYTNLQMKKEADEMDALAKTLQ